MRPFTQAILVIGFITLIFYALNPLEAFDPLVGMSPGQMQMGNPAFGMPPSGNPMYGMPPSGNPAFGMPPSGNPGSFMPPAGPVDLAGLVSKYKNLTPAEREQLQAQVQHQRNQLGLANNGFYTAGLHPELNQQSITPPADMPQISEADVASATVDAKMAALKKAQKIVKDGSSVKAGDGTALTLSDVQGLINSNVQSQLANQPIQNCGLSRAYTPTMDDSPNFNEILKAADEQEQRQWKKENRRESHKRAINTQQMTYRQPSADPATCPPPDPTVWVKRKEIPCWSCKI
jgi:hypothetical protein